MKKLEVNKSQEERKIYLSTPVAERLLKTLKVLAVYEEKRVNHLLEEAITDLVKKYEKQTGRNYGI